jgi:peroxiredoxin
MATATTLYDLKPLDAKGQPFDFKQLDGKVVLIVNVASNCGYTPQYDGLEALYKKFKDRGFVHPGLKSADSRKSSGFLQINFVEPYPTKFDVIIDQQEPGTNNEIQQFCRTNYGVTFPVLGKIDVNGDHTDPVYKYLKSQKSGLLGFSRIK